MRNRIFLLVGYWLVASIVTFLFCGYGDLSLGPYFVLVSWSGFITRLLSQLLGLKELDLLFEGFLIHLSLFILYYVVLIKLVSKLNRGQKDSAYLPKGIHFSGVLVFILVSEKEGILPPGIFSSEALDWRALWYLASYIVSVALTLLWLSLDWRLATKAIRGR